MGILSCYHADIKQIGKLVIEKNRLSIIIILPLDYQINSQFFCVHLFYQHTSGMYIDVMYAYVVIVDTVLDSKVRYESKITQEYRIYRAESIIITIDYWNVSQRSQRIMALSWQSANTRRVWQRLWQRNDDLFTIAVREVWLYHQLLHTCKVYRFITTHITAHLATVFFHKYSMNRNKEWVLWKFHFV